MDAVTLSATSAVPMTLGRWLGEGLEQVELAQSAFRDPLADGNANGISVLHEYAFGLVADSCEGLPVLALETLSDPAGEYPVLTFHRREDAVDLAYTVREGSTLPLSAAVSPAQELEANPLGDVGMAEVRVRAALHTDEVDRQFMAVEVELLP